MQRHMLYGPNSAEPAFSKTGTLDTDVRGLQVYTTPAREYFGAGLQLINADGSSDMAVDGSISGTPDSAYIESTTTNWVQAAISGVWDFASTAITPQGGIESIDATGTIDGNQMQLQRVAPISIADFSSFSGYVYLASFNDAKHFIAMEVRLAGVLQGVSVDITDFVDVGAINAWQRFIIPKAIMGLNGESIDQIVFTTHSSSGQPPDYYLDTINVEEQGSILYTFAPPRGMVFELHSVDFVLRDDVSTIEPENFMGLPALTNGVRVRTQVGGVTRFSGGVKAIADWLDGGSNVKSVIQSPTAAAIQIQGPAPGFTIRIDGNQGDTYSLSVSDNLSSLTSFKTIVRGGILR